MYQTVAERTNFKTKLVALGGISTQNDRTTSQVLMV
jgi:hypothetical protein